MSILKANKLVLLIPLLAIFYTPLILSQPLSLKIAGDSISGYQVFIYSNDQLVIANTEEFSIQLFNLDMSTEANLSWSGQKWSGDKQRITLQRDSYIKEFDANLSVTVTYEVVNPNVIKKTVELFQPSMPGIYYILKETNRPAEKPQRYVTFEHDRFPGSFAHEMFPSVGFITPDNHVIGFLTDAGYKNQYTRNTRRRFSGRGGGFVGMRRLPDVNLFSTANGTEQAQGNDYIRQIFGEMYNLDAGPQTILQMPNVFTIEGNAEVTKAEGVFSMIGHPGGRTGIEFILFLFGAKAIHQSL